MIPDYGAIFMADFNYNTDNEQNKAGIFRHMAKSIRRT
jgi:hypothetical protein